jgi:hypothetical protein
MDDEEWARRAVETLLRRCMQAVLARLQDDAEALLMEITRRR